jgi:2-polyprenyl-3-methyl-5-hydroxy-6-metoxy-1,4-benzoquinol methylase
MAPHGRALLAFAEGDTEVAQIIRRDDGSETSLPVSIFFRTQDQFWPIEHAALARCEGHVLDIGAGSGLHTLALQARGLAVTAIDISPDAVAIMQRRACATPASATSTGSPEARSTHCSCWGMASA